MSGTSRWRVGRRLITPPGPVYLLKAEDNASELEMLRSIASGLGVKWGKEDLGWWRWCRDRMEPRAPSVHLR
jgi:hypothetical protein